MLTWLVILLPERPSCSIECKTLAIVMPLDRILGLVYGRIFPELCPEQLHCTRCVWSLYIGALALDVVVVSVEESA